MSAANLPLELSLQSIRVRALQSVHAAPMILVAALLATWGFMSQVPLSYLASWTVPVCTLALLNRLCCQKILATLRVDSAMDSNGLAETVIRVAERELFWLTIASLVAMATGIWWIALGSKSQALWLVVTLIQCLYSLAAMINASSHPRTFISGAAINLGSLALFWALQGWHGVVVAFALLAMFALLSRMTLQVRRDLEQTMKMRLENRALVESLKLEREYGNAAWAAAEKGNLARSRFLAAASHDLRQPLHTLMLFAGLLETANVKEQQVFVQQIQRTADTLNNMFSGLIDLSKLDAGAIQPTLTDVDVVEFMRPLLEELQANARERSLDCTTQIESVCIVTDPMLLERIVRNLLDNAVKYTHTGSISVKVHSQRIDSSMAVRFEVADSGIGIPAHELERVFDEFVQLDNPGRAQDKGTGLGLAIVKRLCALLDHPIRLESHPGEGTRVTVDVPIRIGQLTAARIRQAEPNPSLAGLRVLVIDDIVSVREAMAAQLRAWNCIPILAADVNEALATMADPQQAPQVVIADFNLGCKQSGFDAIRALRRLNPQLACAVFTGETDAFWQDQTRDKEVPIFQKPVSAHAIRGWLQETLSPQ